MRYLKKMENMPKTKKKRLSADFTKSIHGGWGRRLIPRKDDSGWIFQTYKVTSLSYEMLC